MYRVIILVVLILFLMGASLVWNRNTEYDLDHYTLYRRNPCMDTRVRLFDISKDVNECHLCHLPDGYYYSLTATDVSNNESLFSEEARFR